MTRGSGTASIPTTASPAQLVCDAIVGARDPHFHRDLGLAPFRPRALMLFEADLPNHAENVSSTVERKLDALLAHESQFESTMQAKDGDPALLDAFRTRILDRLAELGEPWTPPRRGLRPDDRPLTPHLGKIRAIPRASGEDLCQALIHIFPRLGGQTARRCDAQRSRLARIRFATPSGWRASWRYVKCTMT